MQGYSDETRQHFNDAVASDKLLFLTIEPSSIPLDMSGRFEPVYERLIDPAGTPVSGGLTRYQFQEDTRYGDELLYIGQRGDKPPFVVRCLNPSDLPKGSRSCLRDLAVGQGLSVAYRFSEGLLDQWRGTGSRNRRLCHECHAGRQAASVIVEIDVENCHRKVERQVAVLVVPEQNAKKLVADIDFAESSLRGRARTCIFGLKVRLK